MGIHADLLTACERGDLETIQLIATRNFSYVVAGINLYFVNACTFGHLHIAKYLLQLKPDLDVCLLLNTPAKTACENGQLHVVEWLLETNPNIIHISKHWTTFMFACINNHLHVAKWLFQLNPNINICHNNNYIFVSSCRNNQVHVANWLREIKPFKYFIKKRAIINNTTTENTLFILYVLHKKRQIPNLVTNLIIACLRF